MAHEDLRRTLLRGDLEIAETQPVLMHLLSRKSSAWFSDDTLARVRSMVRSLAADTLEREDGWRSPQHLSFADQMDDLVGEMTSNALILCYIHSLVLEGKITYQLEAEFGVPTAHSVLMRDDGHERSSDLGRLVSASILAQTRFMALYERMDLRLADIPSDVCSAVMALSRSSRTGHATLEQSSAARRTSLFFELVDHPHFYQSRALDLAHAGFGVFASALARQSGQERELVVLCAASGHSARIALSLKSLGVSEELCQRNLALLNVDSSLVEKLSEVSPSDASLILKQSGLDR